MKLTSLSWSHKASASPAREALASLRMEDILNALKLRGIGEAVAISTCNRFELYAATTACESQKTDLLGLLSHLTDSSITNEVEAREDAEAVRHLFSVAAGLDSLVIGESEILGQVKTAYEQAKSCGLTGKRLNVLFQRALYVGKKVRSETGIASGSMSVPSVAVQLAETIFGKLEGKSALVLGAGAMAELAAKHLVARGIESLRVANRTWQRAYALAARFQGDTCPWEDFPTALIHADVVISSTGAPQAVITRPMVVEAMEHRAGRSLFLIDIAMPRDIEESVHNLEGVYLYRLEDLESIVARNMSERGEAVGHARRIVEEKADEFDAWAKSLSSGRELSLRHSGRPR